MAPPKVEVPLSKDKYPSLPTGGVGAKSRRTVMSTVNNGSNSRDPLGSGVGAEGSNGQQTTADGVDGVLLELSSEE